MQPAQPRSPQKNTVVCIGICALIVITLGLFGACNPAPEKSNKQQPLATPSPTPLATPLEAETPIVVKGGGSIDLDFDENIFPGSPPKCPDCKIMAVSLQQIPPPGPIASPSPTPVPCTFTGDPTISVVTAGANDDITIKGTSGGVEIGFVSGRYPGIITACGDARKHHSKNGVITAVKVNNQPCGGCTVFKRCKIDVTVSR